ncbi:MAG: primosomal protein N' (replication factor Y) - superfamily II helicase [Alphaproteobacteria bacterium]
MPWNTEEKVKDFEAFVADEAEASMATDEYPCQACGSALHFSPNAQTLECGHCGNLNEIRVSQDSHLLEHDLAAAIHGLADKQDYEQVRVAKCHACAAEFEFDPHQHAQNCPFCSTAIVADTSTANHIKPHGVVPFAVTEKDARDKVANWLKGLWFAPTKVKAYAREAAGFEGIYSPYWTYDSSTRSSYAGQRGDTYYEQVRVSTMVDGKRVTKTQSVPKIRWTQVAGNVARDFDDVLVLASHSLPERITKNLEHWDLRAAKPYNGAYVAGFRAESYQVDVEEGLVEAEAVMDQVIRADVRRSIGGDHQRISWVRTKHANQTFKHMLLPIWVSAFKFQNKTYRYVVNGQTGEVQGERPYSPIKIAFAVVVGLLIAGAIFAIYAATS